eukprot:jgi/Tetstr1/434722/TSEL_023775.t1
MAAAVARRCSRPGWVAAAGLPLLLLALSSTALLPLAGGSTHRQLESRGAAAEVAQLALQGRAGDVRAWFGEHFDSCINQRRLLSVAEGGGLAGGLSQKSAERFWSARLVQSGDAQLEVGDREMARYRLLKPIKNGNYGEVFLAYDNTASKLVAIKKIPRVFHTNKTGPRTHNPARGVWLEITLPAFDEAQRCGQLRLAVATTCPNARDIMSMERVLKPRNRHTFESIYQVYELLEGAPVKYLAQQMLTHSEAERLKLNVFQLLRGLHYMHSANLTHNDLRAKNTMVDAECNLKIIDLGLGRKGTRTPKSNLHFPLRNDVGWYARDMWMLGSTILYLIGGAGQFRMSSTNASDRERAATIIKVLGAPSNQAIDKYGAEEQSVWREAKKTHKQVMPLRARFPNADLRLIDLIQLIMAPDRHPPPLRELLRHSYFADLDQSTIQDAPHGATETLERCPLIDGSSPRRASRGRAAEVVRLALQGRAADVKAWFEEHPESCANQRRLLGVAEDGGLAGGLNPKETKTVLVDARAGVWRQPAANSSVFYSDRKEAEMRKPGCAVLTEIELLQITRHGDDVMNMERVYEVLEALPPKYRPESETSHPLKPSS